MPITVAKKNDKSVVRNQKSLNLKQSDLDSQIEIIINLYKRRKYTEAFEQLQQSSMFQKNDNLGALEFSKLVDCSPSIIKKLYCIATLLLNNFLIAETESIIDKIEIIGGTTSLVTEWRDRLSQSAHEPVTKDVKWVTYNLLPFTKQEKACPIVKFDLPDEVRFFKKLPENTINNDICSTDKNAQAETSDYSSLTLEDIFK